MKAKRPKIVVERIPWWHGDAWPIILAYRGSRPIYRTPQHGDHVSVKAV